MQETLTNTTESPLDPIISVKSLWKIFGSNQEEIVNSDDGETDKTEVLQDYGDVVALNDVSFDVYPGETFVVMGLSGSGKSTLVRCLLRLIEPSSGEININDDDILLYDADRLREFRRNEMAMVFQHFGLLPHRNVIDNAAYGLEIKGVDKDERYEIAQEMLNKVGLEGWEEARTSELSGGMQQRVGLARALTVDPTILLMDEPLGALDKNLRNDMQKQIKNLHKDLNITVVYVTHDQDEAMFLSDKIVLMDEGKIIQTGTCEELYTKPKNRFVANFLGECNFFTLDSGKKITIRPECLRISGDNKNDRNSFQVDVEDVVFQGRMIKLIGNYNEQEIIASISPLEYELESNHKDKIFLTYDSESLMNI